MKYMIMLYGSQHSYDLMTGKVPGGPPPEAFDPIHEHMGKVMNELAASGELVGGEGLDEPVHTRRLQLKDGVQVVTDGPYAETQEVLAGYTIVDCASFDRATEIAAMFAAAPGPKGLWDDEEYIDVRPIADGPPRPE